MKDKHPKEYTYGERLALVNAGLMAPEDLGILPTPGDKTEATEGGVEIKPATPEELAKKPELGDYVVFQAALVPLMLRGEWARLDYKQEHPLDPKLEGFNKETWMEEHKDEHVIQAKFQCGTASGTIEGKFSDKILGLTNLLNAAAEQIKKFYEQEKNPEKEAVADSIST